MRSQSLFCELQIILDILSCVERSGIAEGVILSCALRGAQLALNDPKLNENNGSICSLYEREIENFGEDKDAESTKRSAKE